MIKILKKLKKKPSEHKDIFIFDFDGTIADTMLHLINISNRLAESFGYDTVKSEKVEEMRSWTSKQVFKHLNVPFLKIPRILNAARLELNKDLEHIKSFDGIKEALEELKERGHQIGIFTSNSEENVHLILKKNDLDIFDFVLSTPKLWNKNRGLKRIIKKNNFNKEKMVYIGDETRDIQAAKKIGIRSMAVAWGYNTIERLKGFEPDYVAYTPNDILQCCER
ncbi:MAG: phosphoglycolate phosphatase [Candidatus Omnitrophota bacterium]|jgi:phosphoglycolate phosphatase